MGKKLMSSNMMTTMAALTAHFQSLKQQGWEVDDSAIQAQSKAMQSYGRGGTAPGGTPFGPGSSGELVWKARKSDSDPWTEYIWTMYMPDPRTLPSPPNPSNVFDMLWIVPKNDAALEIHNQLGLPLPPNFKLGDPGFFGNPSGTTPAQK